MKPCVVKPIGWTGTEIQELKETVQNMDVERWKPVVGEWKQSKLDILK